MKQNQFTYLSSFWEHSVMIIYVVIFNDVIIMKTYFHCGTYETTAVPLCNMNTADVLMCRRWQK